MFTEVGVQDARPQTLRWIRTLACRAVWTARGPRPGPVHLNLPLREPLVLDEPLPEEEPGGGGRPDGRPWVGHLPAVPDTQAVATALAPVVAAAPRGVVVLGRGERPATVAGELSGLARAAEAFSERSGWPLLADPLSGARGAGAIAHYDALLRVPAFADAAVRGPCCGSATCPHRSRCESGLRGSMPSRCSSTPTAHGRTPRTSAT